MVLKVADFGRCRESSQTHRIVTHVLANGFLTTCGIVRGDFGWIPKDPKSADFEQKAAWFLVEEIVSKRESEDILRAPMLSGTFSLGSDPYVYRLNW